MAACAVAALLPVNVGVVYATFTDRASNVGNAFRANASFGLQQPAGVDGCVSDTGTGGTCTDGSDMDEAAEVTVSPDTNHVYVASNNGHAVLAYSRNTSTGALTPLGGTNGCVAETGSATCVDGTALTEPYDVLVSPDNNHVYAASGGSDSVTAFTRDTFSGVLTQLAGTAGCVSETGTAGACVDGKGLDQAIGLGISPDGTSVYAASLVSDAVTVFSRNTSTGALTQLAGTAGCVSETGTGGTCVDGKGLNGANNVTVSPDGAYVYVASYVSDAVAVFSRNTSTGALTQLAGTSGCISETGTGGTCVDGKGLNGANAPVISPDGAFLYASSEVSGAVAAFARNTSTGVLTQLAGTAGCISETGSSGTCADGKALTGAINPSMSPDGENIYVPDFVGNAVAVLGRNPTTGALIQEATTRGCVSETGTGGACVDGRGLEYATGSAVSPDGRDVYVASALSDAIAILPRTH